MQYPKIILALFVSVLLGACGGGGSSSSGTATPPSTAASAPVAGQLLDATLLKTIGTAEVASALSADGDAAFLATPRYPVQAWRLSYYTVDGQGRQVIASGLVALPQKPAGATSPVLSYQHATIKRQADAPSRLTDVGEPPVVLASLGYIVVAADYVGYGVSLGSPHPYLLSAPSAAAVVDFLTAAKTWRQSQKIADNGQLFMTGYSEGGYVTVAAQRALQAGATPHRDEIVHVVAGAGPYDVRTTLDLQLAKVRDDNPLLAEILSPNVLKRLGDSDRRKVTALLLAQTLGTDAEVTFMTTAIDNYLSDDRAAIEAASNVFDWSPQAPLSLFHGRDDRTVTYLNSSLTLQVMRGRGAGDRVTLTDCVAQPAGHSECVLPYWRLVLDRFGRLAKDL
ncbi:alpha/beta hydrolase family protein [Ramlibacter sp.]|uniref:alpha/beta hydrolase family protein n=1 Tax=Ramlibacter sp. TaxID=1917967 RepID=UPI003D1047C4